MDIRIAPADIFPWNENFETGVSVIDEQHRKLVELLNKLAGRLAFGVDTPELNSIFDEMANYAQHHFKTEEGMWRKYLPADELTAEHSKTHQSFITDVVQLRGKQDSLATEQVIEEIVIFLTH
jgi:hemerythrin-like metal-binding protein